MTDTIFALSSGALPAAIAVVRISGPDAFGAAVSLTGRLPRPRQAALRALRSADSDVLLDRALVLVFPGPVSATGEDVVELQLHGGRAVVAAVEAELARRPGMRRALPGEFTRRALANGRIDLAQAEGLGDLLSAETEAQRRAALTTAEGAVSRLVGEWRVRLLNLAAAIEANLDFADEGDVAEADATPAIGSEAASLADAIDSALAVPPVERVRDGLRVVLGGPPNSGKSTLFNALAGRDAAIVSPIAGTTRDRIEAPVQREGRAYVLVDTAGLTASSHDPVERIGVDRAAESILSADILLWLGDDEPVRPDAVLLQARADMAGRSIARDARISVSAATGQGIDLLWRTVAQRADRLLPAPDAVALNIRQHALIRRAAAALHLAANEKDMVVLAEHCRIALAVLAHVTGDVGVEAMLDTLFSRFCIGK